MSIERVCLAFFRAVGILLVILGAVHLIATPHIPKLLGPSSTRLYRQAIGPTLLNHVLVGILLFPLGYTTWLAAAAVPRGEAWAGRVLVVNTLVMFTMPVLVAVCMRQPQYYTAPLFVAGVGLVAILCLMMAAAVFLLWRERSMKEKAHIVGK